MKYTKEDLEKIKLPLTRETFVKLEKNYSSLPPVSDWPKEFLKQYVEWQSKLRDERHPELSDCE